jgi:hypothetical protein
MAVPGFRRGAVPRLGGALPHVFFTATGMPRGEELARL